jgi:hypothetical protein
MTAVPADADALSDCPLGNTGAHFIDDARDFVSWNAGILNSGPQAVFREHIAVADTTGLHLDADLSCIGGGNLTFDDLEICSRFGDLRRLHRRCRDFCRIHKSSYKILAFVEKHPIADLGTPTLCGIAAGNTSRDRVFLYYHF